MEKDVENRLNLLLDKRLQHKKILDEIDAEIQEIDNDDPDYHQVYVPAFGQNKVKFKKSMERFKEISIIENIDQALKRETQK
jgi:imidazoleglycerol phosphate synthase glutamine amidotransferase subunit HisH